MCSVAVSVRNYCKGGKRMKCKSKEEKCIVAEINMYCRKQ